MEGPSPARHAGLSIGSGDSHGRNDRRDPGNADGAVAIPCRIVGVVDGQTRWGFAYGTLPGHPEQGEESFVVSMAPDDTVHFEIEAFSRPGDPLVRLSGPIGRGVQRGGTGAYLRALKRYVEGAG